MSEIVFACYSKACAPPPAGTGGSEKGGARARAEWRSAINQSDHLVTNHQGKTKVVTLKRGRVSTEWSVSKRNPNNPHSKWDTKKGRTLNHQEAVDRALDAFLSPN